MSTPRPIRAARAEVALLGVLILAFACNGEKSVPASDGPARIVSLVPAATETLFRLGVGDSVVGRSAWCDRPPEAADLPVVGDALSVNVESVLSYKPTLVLVASEQQKRALAPLEGRTRVLTVLPETVADVREMVALLARETGREAAGRELTGEIDAALAAARERGAGAGRRVLFVVQQDPLVVGGAGSVVGDLLEVLGAENVAGDIARPWPVLSLETLVARDPDVIIDASVSRAGGFWERFPTVSAVKSGRVHRFSDVSLVRPGPSLPELISALEGLVGEGR